MHKLTTLSLKNKALIALITIVAAVFGGLSYASLKQELIPSIEIPTLAVVSIHPGASAEVVAADVSTPIEKALQTVPGLKDTTTSSSTGMSMVLAEFDFGIDTAKVEQKMTQAVNRISSVLPENVEPEVMAFNFDDFPVIQIAVSGEDTEAMATKLHELVVPELERISGVASASVLGAPGQRVHITPNLAELTANGLSAADLGTVLANNGILMPVGTVTDDGHQMAIQIGDRLGSARDIAGLPLVVMGAAPGSEITVGDVATVELTNDPVSSYSLVNGEKSLTLSITKRPDANTVDVSDLVREAMPELETMVPGAHFEILIDQAPFISESIASLGTEGLLGLVMAILVILVFLRSGRATLVTAVSIPTSLLIAFVAMQAAGYSLNMLSLGGLTIAIGRIVDDSIVVIENVERHMRYGKTRRATIVDAVKEVSGAITASTVTTIVVFLPIALVGGMAGILFRPFAFTVAVAMGASLLVALTIVPVLAYWFLNWRHGGKLAEHAASEDDLEEEPEGAIQRIYARLLDWVIAHRWMTVSGAIIILIGTVALSPLLKTNFLGDMGQNQVGVTQAVAPGTSLDAQLDEAERINDVLEGVAGVDMVAVTIGGDASSMMMGASSDAISYTLSTDPDGDQIAIEQAVRDALEGVIADEDLSISPMAGMGMSNNVEIAVTGADVDAVAEATALITATMRDLPAARQVTNSITEARPTVSISVDRDKAASLGLTESAVSQMVRGLMTPQQIGAITIDGSSVNVYLSPNDPPATVAAIETADLLPGFTVGDLATIDVIDGPVTITTKNAIRNQTVTITPDSDDIGQASSAVTTALEEISLPAGVTADIGGITQEQNEAFSQLGLAMLIAILIVYVVMVATFRSLLHPLLLLVSVPFATTGAILLQLATRIPLGVPSLIGVVMLIGIVVTNAIVLIDLVKQYRDRGVGMTDALRKGAIHRVRPILMTALATILALLPMAIGITGQGGFISQPLAIVVIGGLFSSTAMTLIVLPALYHLVESVGTRGATRVLEE